jgi:hypothetical protein
MRDSSNKDFYKSADEIIKTVKEYSDEHIQSGLADIHTRVKNVVMIKQLDEEQDRHNPVFYTVNNIRQMHSSATADYYKFRENQELGLKVTIIGRISTMDGELKILEIEEEEADNE